jgi:microcystin-dependent protein
MDHYLAEIRPFAGKTPPQDWMLCDGRSLSITEYQALYSLLGTGFGGDGVNNFQLPDLRGRLPIGSGLGSGLSINYTYASKGGSESVTLNIGQIPVHNHAFNVTSASATSNSPVNNLFANPSPNVFYATTPSSGSPSQILNADTVPSSSGDGLPHENRMPTMAINYIIAVVGAYPTQQ